MHDVAPGAPVGGQLRGARAQRSAQRHDRPPAQGRQRRDDRVARIPDDGRRDGVLRLVRPAASSRRRAARRRARARALERRADELAEERRRARRPRLELRVELARDEPRVVGQLDDLDQPPLLERARDDEARVDELLAVLVVDLVAVAVALVDDGLVVGVARPRPLRDLDRLRAEPHRAAEILDLLLLREQVDHRVRRLGIHLGRVGALEPDDVPRELGDGDVHAEADAEVRDPALARDPAGEDLALPAARAEAAGDEDAVDLLEQLGRLLVGHVLGVDPVDAHLRALVDARVLERLVHREVGVVELHVLADERDRHLLARLADPVDHVLPLAEVGRRRLDPEHLAARARRGPPPAAPPGRDRRRARPARRRPSARRRRRRARSCP